MKYFALILLLFGPLSGAYLAIKSASVNQKTLKLFLSFAGGYLLAVTFLNLIPEVFSGIQSLQRDFGACWLLFSDFP
jgi:zinc transporter ZupT